MVFIVQENKIMKILFVPFVMTIHTIDRILIKHKQT
jgi:hypothetical protein